MVTTRFDMNNNDIISNQNSKKINKHNNKNKTQIMTANMKFNGDLSRWEGRNIQFTFLYETSGFAAETWRNSRFFTTARRHRSEACRS